MNHKNSSKSGLFLMELILAIFFFSIAAAICVRLFVTSHRLSRESVQLNHAVTMAESIAEAFYGCNGEEAQLIPLLNDLYSGSVGSPNTLAASATTSVSGTATEAAENVHIFSIYDEDKNMTARITTSQDGELVSCRIGIYSGNPQPYASLTVPIYELNVSLYPQEGVYETE